MSKKYIIYWGRCEYPNGNALAHRVRANAKLLKIAGYEVILVGYSKDIKTFEKIVCDGNVCYILPYPQKVTEWIKDFRSYRFIEKIILQNRSISCKAIMFTGVGMENMRGLLRISNKHNIDLISDSVDWFAYKEGSLLYRLYKTIEQNVEYKYLKPKAYNIICISTYLQQYFNSKKCNTVVIPSLTDGNDFRFQNLPAYTPSSNIRFCYAGNPGIKGSKDRIDWCVKAFYELSLPNVYLDIYGLTKEQFCHDFPELSNHAKHPTIVFYGKYPNNACIAAIAIADFFLFARKDSLNTRAGFPTKFSESMAIGTPVVTTPAGDIANYLFDGVNGFISEECTYLSFKTAISKASCMSLLERLRMHQIVKEYQMLDISSWSETMRDFLNSV